MRKIDRQLLLAVQEDYLNRALSLIDEGASVNAAFRDGRTCLIFAASKNSPDMLLVLLSKGADINVAEKTGRTPLIVAAHNGRIDNVLLLLDAGADVTKTDRLGFTAEDHAKRRGHSRIQSAFHGEPWQWSYMCLPSWRRRQHEQLAHSTIDRQLLSAVSTADCDLIHNLVGQGANVDTMDKDGYTPLMQATIMGSVNVVDILLSNGAKLDLMRVRFPRAGICTRLFRSESGFTYSPYTVVNAEALKVGSYETVQLEYYDYEDTGMTALMWAARYDQAEIIDRLVAAGADIHDTNFQKLSALCIAVKEGALKAAERLLAAGANPDNIIWHSPFDPDNADWGWEDFPLLASAAAEDRPELVQLLLAAGADVNYHTNQRTTALMYAAKRGAVKCAQLLIAAHADINVEDHDNRTALDLAIEEDRTEIVRLLEASV